MSTFQRRFSISICFIISILTVIVSLIIISLMPLYLNKSEISFEQYPTDYPINATYLLPTAKSESLTKWSSIDRSKLQNSFENALNLKQKNVLEVMQIGQETALSRRKRYIRCEEHVTDASGDAVIFQFQLNYPRRLICRSSICIQTWVAKVIQHFKYTSTISIDVYGQATTLRLCSIGIFPITYDPNNTTFDASSTISNTHAVLNSISTTSKDGLTNESQSTTNNTSTVSTVTSTTYNVSSTSSIKEQTNSTTIPNNTMNYPIPTSTKNTISTSIQVQEQTESNKSEEFYSIATSSKVQTQLLSITESPIIKTESSTSYETNTPLKMQTESLSNGDAIIGTNSEILTSSEIPARLSSIYHETTSPKVQIQSSPTYDTTKSMTTTTSQAQPPTEFSKVQTKSSTINDETASPSSSHETTTLLELQTQSFSTRDKIISTGIVTSSQTKIPFPSTFDEATSSKIQPESSLHYDTTESTQTSTQSSSNSATSLPLMSQEQYLSSTQQTQDAFTEVSKIQTEISSNDDGTTFTKIKFLSSTSYEATTTPSIVQTQHPSSFEIHTSSQMNAEFSSNDGSIAFTDIQTQSSTSLETTATTTSKILTRFLSTESPEIEAKTSSNDGTTLFTETQTGRSSSFETSIGTKVQTDSTPNESSKTQYFSSTETTTSSTESSELETKSTANDGLVSSTEVQAQFSSRFITSTSLKQETQYSVTKSTSFHDTTGLIKMQTEASTSFETITSSNIHAESSTNNQAATLYPIHEIISSNIPTKFSSDNEATRLSKETPHSSMFETATFSEMQTEAFTDNEATRLSKETPHSSIFENTTFSEMQTEAFTDYRTLSSKINMDSSMSDEATTSSKQEIGSSSNDETVTASTFEIETFSSHETTTLSNERTSSSLKYQTIEQSNGQTEYLPSDDTSAFIRSQTKPSSNYNTVTPLQLETEETARYDGITTSLKSQTNIHFDVSRDGTTMETISSTLSYIREESTNSIEQTTIEFIKTSVETEEIKQSTDNDHNQKTANTTVDQIEIINTKDTQIYTSEDVESSTLPYLQLSTQTSSDQYSTVELIRTSYEKTSDDLNTSNQIKQITSDPTEPENTIDPSRLMTSSLPIPTITEYLSFISTNLMISNTDYTLPYETTVETTSADEFTTREPDICIIEDPVATGYVPSTRMTHTSLYSPYDNSVYIINGIVSNVNSDGVNVIEKHDGLTGKIIEIYTCPTLGVFAYIGASFMPTKNIILLSGGILMGQNLVSDAGRLFDPISGLLSSIKMSQIRASHGSVVSTVSNKIILISGGDTPSSTNYGLTGDVFDGAKFRPVKNTLRYGRLYHTSTYISSIDKVLIAGGVVSDSNTPYAANTLELYDVATNEFQFIPVNMSVARIYHTATYVPPPVDKVFIFGGTDFVSMVTTYDIFDVKTLTIKHVNQSNIIYYVHTATLLDDQESILLMVAMDMVKGTYLCQIYNSVTDTFMEVLCPKTLRLSHTTTLIESTGFVYLCYGLDFTSALLNNCEVYRPTPIITSTLA